MSGITPAEMAEHCHRIAMAVCSDEDISEAIKSASDLISISTEDVLSAIKSTKVASWESCLSHIGFALLTHDHWSKHAYGTADELKAIPVKCLPEAYNEHINVALGGMVDLIIASTDDTATLSKQLGKLSSYLFNIELERMKQNGSTDAREKDHASCLKELRLSYTMCINIKSCLDNLPEAILNETVSSSSLNEFVLKTFNDLHNPFPTKLEPTIAKKLFIETIRLRTCFAISIELHELSQRLLDPTLACDESGRLLTETTKFRSGVLQIAANFFSPNTFESYPAGMVTALKMLISLCTARDESTYRKTRDRANCLLGFYLLEPWASFIQSQTSTLPSNIADVPTPAPKVIAGKTYQQALIGLCKVTDEVRNLDKSFGRETLVPAKPSQQRVSKKLSTEEYRAIALGVRKTTAPLSLEGVHKPASRKPESTTPPSLRLPPAPTGHPSKHFTHGAGQSPLSPIASLSPGALPTAFTPAGTDSDSTTTPPPGTPSPVRQLLTPTPTKAIKKVNMGSPTRSNKTGASALLSLVSLSAFNPKKRKPDESRQRKRVKTSILQPTTPVYDMGAGASPSPTPSAGGLFKPS